jgi:FMN phosphatase YigB (HAD superfamily)
MSSPIRLVCFDLGRVLIRICDGWREACGAAGVEAPAAELTREQWAGLLNLINRIEVGEGGIDEFCAEAGRCLGIDSDVVARVWRHWTLGPYPGAVELLADLRAAGVKTACLSNTNVRHWEVMNDSSDPQFPVLAGLDFRFASHLIRRRKPDERAYEYVERETGVGARAILFFDDLAENIEAANRRGWRGRLVDRCENPVPLIREALRREGVL